MNTSTHIYRVLEDGEQIWQGCAHSEDSALETALGEETGSALYRIERAGKVRVTSEICVPGWEHCWTGRLA